MITDVTDLFLRENVNQPEVRVNIALFSLMQQIWFREWFLRKLHLPMDAIVYPPKKISQDQPDLKVVNANRDTVAWLEVELGRDSSQLERFRRKLTPDVVKSIWGTPSDGGDLSLKEISDYLTCLLKEKTDIPSQTSVNVQQLIELIEDGLEGYRGSPKRTKLSKKMKEDNPLVVALIEQLGNRVLVDLAGNEPPPPGYFKADTTDTKNNRGFSLRVYSPKVSSSSGRTLSIMSIQAGSQWVCFPSFCKLRKYLPHCPRAVDSYRSALGQMQLDISEYREKQRPSLPLAMVVGRLNDLLPAARALAGCYGDCTECPGPAG